MAIVAARPARGRGLFYTRDSGGKHELTPGQYVNWAAGRARDLGVSFSGTAAAIDEMMRLGEFHRGDLFLDFDVQGRAFS